MNLVIFLRGVLLSWWRFDDGIYKYGKLDFCMRDDKGQVTIFIIVGVVIVIGVLFLFFMMMQDGTDLNPGNLGPRDFIRDCVINTVDASLDKIMKNGGYADPSLKVEYDDLNWSYLCYTPDYYKGCYNIRPMLELWVEDEIVRDSAGVIENCFDDMQEDLEDRGFDVDSGPMNYSVDLLPGYVDVSLKKRVDINGVDGTRNFEDFGFESVSSIYDLVGVSRIIVNSESEFCNFDYNVFMMLYPRYDIKRVDFMDNKIYSVRDRRSGEKFRFAVRSCAFPPGV